MIRQEFKRGSSNDGQILIAKHYGEFSTYQNIYVTVFYNVLQFRLSFIRPLSLYSLASLMVFTSP